MFISEEELQSRFTRFANHKNLFSHQNNNSNNGQQGQALSCQEPQTISENGSNKDESGHLSQAAVVENLAIERIGKPTGKKRELPEQLKPLIGALSIISSQTAVAKEFGVGQQTASAYASGRRHSSYSEKDEKLESAIDRHLGKVRETAFEKLIGSLGLITEDKLKSAKVRDVSSVASDMSKIVERTLPKSPQVGVGVQIVIHAPQQKDEDDYLSVEV